MINLIRILQNFPEFGDVDVLVLFEKKGPILGFISQVLKLPLQRLNHISIALGMKGILAEDAWGAVALQRLGRRPETISRDITVTTEDRIA
ncbi:hypothetical protein VO64_1316 [Pseudomonas synxantha]|uniref:Uncharacterized protein n=1 Tax=Pseudomonas synxantha TaxID=47883 RepID=A0AAU8TV71_9PSED|nr:hypothetical protein VO64_1316 [Pseudomonas synxantha]